LADAEFDLTSRTKAIDDGATKNNFIMDDNVGCGMPNNELN
jgi:hypothetical protein